MTDADFEEFGYAEIRHRFDRGDFHDLAELRAVEKWLRAKDKEREFLVACKHASMSSALEATRAARRANLIALFALALAAISAHDQVGVVVGSIMSTFSRW
jgi:hypothetical protein